MKFWSLLGQLEKLQIFTGNRSRYDIYGAFHLISHKINIENLLNFIKMDPAASNISICATLTSLQMSTHSFFVSHSQWKGVKYGDFTTQGI